MRDSSGMRSKRIEFCHLYNLMAATCDEIRPRSERVLITAWNTMSKSDLRQGKNQTKVSEDQEEKQDEECESADAEEYEEDDQCGNTRIRLDMSREELLRIIGQGDSEPICLPRDEGQSSLPAACSVPGYSTAIHQPQEPQCLPTCVQPSLLELELSQHHPVVESLPSTREDLPVPNPHGIKLAFTDEELEPLRELSRKLLRKKNKWSRIHEEFKRSFPDTDLSLDALRKRIDGRKSRASRPQEADAAETTRSLSPPLSESASIAHSRVPAAQQPPQLQVQAAPPPHRQGMFQVQENLFEMP